MKSRGSEEGAGIPLAAPGDWRTEVKDSHHTTGLGVTISVVGVQRSVSFCWLCGFCFCSITVHAVPQYQFDLLIMCSYFVLCYGVCNTTDWVSWERGGECL